MSKKKKRLERMRRNRNNVSFDDFVIILEDFGFVLRAGGKESHRIARLKTEDKTFTVTFVRPHGNKKFINSNAVKELLIILDEIATLLPDTTDEDEDDGE